MKLMRISGGRGFTVVAKTKRSQVATMVLAEGETTGGPAICHGHSDQWMLVLSGYGRAVVGGHEVGLEKGVLLLIEPGEPHEIINRGSEPLHTLNFYSPPAY